MLNRAKVMSALRHIQDDLFHDISDEINCAREVWERITKDATFIHKIRACEIPLPLPLWDGDLGEAIAIDPKIGPYTILGVDGSQIYPDKHQGSTCFLINIGSVLVSYGQPGKGVHLESVPYVFVHSEEDEWSATPDIVNCRREEFEFEAGSVISQAVRAEQSPDTPYLFVSDGSLIFWHLESKDIPVRDFFLSRYCALLDELYDQKTLCAGYISLPKNKELVNLVRVALADFNTTVCMASTAINHVVDTTLVSMYLEPHTRTTIFKSGAPIAKHYPDHLAPYFFYLHTGDEIARVEIPAWIALDEAAVTSVTRMLLDQSVKGRGYPVVLAEAHEQAVVKGPDREFFYQVITKLSIERKQRILLSQKSVKKRSIGI
jgi:hypothetical protein